MKKGLLASIVFTIFLFNYSNAAIFQQVADEKIVGYDIPSCFSDKSFCFIGNYAVRASGKEKLYVDFGIVCNEAQTYCTNGSYVAKSNNFILKIVNKYKLQNLKMNNLN